MTERQLPRTQTEELVVAVAALRPPAAAAYIDVSIGKLWKLVKDDPDFPQPIKAAPRITLFLTSALDKWLAAKAAASTATRNEHMKRVRAYRSKHDGEFEKPKASASKGGEATEEKKQPA
ncbi:hypothetical protein [Paraburkholderia sp. J10-1]|uniref:helix-turn-helix transcriptional regulator n=1 Tax=Paraburkholderia sp. J10-1 TaxID=2805430 RepID=UPI002AB6864F|nr:hypothetical protein [Paraburkholderia sp. J10-1]